MGRYRDRWVDLQVLVHQGNLIIIDPTSPDPLADAAKLEPLPNKPHTFRMKSDSGFAGPEELAVFELDEAGKVIRLKNCENYVERVEQW